MTNLIIPYSFTPGSKARADEVNANFNEVAFQVNSLSDSLNNLNDSVNTAITNYDVKADKDFSNLSETAEKHFVNRAQITDCILAAPNGVVTYENNVFTIKAGLELLIADGRNTDNTLKNAVKTFENDEQKVISNLTANSQCYLIIDKDGVLYWADKNYSYCQSTEPSVPAEPGYWKDTVKNISYVMQTATWLEKHAIIIAEFTTDNDKLITSVLPYQPFEIYHAHFNTPRLANGEIRTVVDSYTNGNSWYRVWNDGWIEQGGVAVGFNSCIYMKPFVYTPCVQVVPISGEYCMSVTINSVSNLGFYLGNAIHGGSHENRYNVSNIWFAAGM